MNKKLLSVPEFITCQSDEDYENHGNSMMNAIYEISEEITKRGAIIIKHYVDIGHIDIPPCVLISEDGNDLNDAIEGCDYKNGVDVYGIDENCYQICVHGSTYKLLRNGKYYNTEAVITIRVNE